MLLDGVTGSGKTEVYFEAVAEALRQDKQALVLLPEIALTEPFLKRFQARFGTAPVAWHSDLRSSQRRRAWRAIASGEAKVVVGARSALFLPYSNLGLIVVDEAHEPSFKQEEGVHYHARDVAVMLAKFEDIPVILSSATPPIESRHMVELGRYREVQLASRFAGATLPTIAAIDLTQDPPPRGRWLAPSLVRNGKPISPRASSPSFSIAAASPRPSAAIAGIGSNARIAPRGWSSTADASPRLPPLRPRHAAAPAVP